MTNEMNDRIRNWLPEFHPLWKQLVDRDPYGFFLSEESQYFHLSAVCLRDLADTMQWADRALRSAMHEWLSRTDYSETPDQNWAIHHSRFFFDYGAIALCAASNHLASAMWHFEEREVHPLGRGYKTANRAMQTWRQRNSQLPPASHAILESLLCDQNWKIINDYRDQWVHRGMPIIAGEVRRARRDIWQSVRDNPPSVPVLFQIVTSSDRIAYFVQNDEPQYAMIDLLNAGAKAFAGITDSTKQFLALFDAAYKEVFRSEHPGGDVNFG